LISPYVWNSPCPTPLGGSSFYPESSWTSSCSMPVFPFIVIFREASDSTDGGDLQLLPCSSSHLTGCVCQVCPPSCCFPYHELKGSRRLGLENGCRRASEVGLLQVTH
jgi:hypothetical protein